MIESLESLQPDPRNARKHSKDNIELISSSLREVGAARSIVIDEHDVVPPSPPGSSTSFNHLTDGQSA